MGVWWWYPLFIGARPYAVLFDPFRVYPFEVITIDLLNKIGITSRNTPSRYIETNGGTSPDNDP